MEFPSTPITIKERLQDGELPQHPVSEDHAIDTLDRLVFMGDHYVLDFSDLWEITEACGLVFQSLGCERGVDAIKALLKTLERQNEEE
jgi:hypothetical protein